MQKDTQPSQTFSEGYTLSATALYRCVSLYLGSINWTLLVRFEANESDMRRCLDACASTEHLVWGTDANALLVFLCFWESIN